MKKIQNIRHDLSELEKLTEDLYYENVRLRLMLHLLISTHGNTFKEGIPKLPEDTEFSFSTEAPRIEVRTTGPLALRGSHARIEELYKKMSE